MLLARDLPVVEAEALDVVGKEVVLLGVGEDVEAEGLHGGVDGMVRAYDISKGSACS